MNFVTHKHLIAGCMFITYSALAGYAAQFDDFTYVEYDTYIEITDYPGSGTGDITIPSEIVGKPVTSIGDSAFRSCTNLTSVSIPDSVISIGEYAFIECTSLTNLTIGNGVTEIGGSAFQSCTNLTSVTIPASVTRFDGTAFRFCTKLTAIMVNGPNPVYSSLDGVVFNKNQTSLVEYPPGRAGDYTLPESVTTIGELAFYDCYRLTSIEIGNGVTSIGDRAFRSCTSLRSVTIPDSVASIGGAAFEKCYGLATVTVGSGMTYIGNQAFRECHNLSTIFFTGHAPDVSLWLFFGSDNATIYYLPGTTGWGESFSGRPTEEAPLGGIPVDGLEGWFVSEWFGYYATTLDPWLFHAQHGFIYRYPESTNASLYFYDDAMSAWWWTNEANYPSLYAFNPPADNMGTDIESAWLWYFEGSKGPRSFVVLKGASAGTYLYFDP